MIVLVSWTGACHLSPQGLDQMIQQIKAGLSAPLRKPRRGNVIGQARTCWNTAFRAAKKQGGRPLGGWSVIDQEPRLPQSNRFARIVLNAHCILENNENWYEMIPERYAADGFIPGIVPNPEAYVEFYDDEASVRCPRVQSR